MRAVVCSGFGPPEDLKVAEVAAPEPGPGEVRVAVEACGVNFPDLLIVEGKYQLRPDPPFSPGGEVAGRVDALGEGVTGLAEGDAVIAISGYGGFAEEIVVKAGQVTPRPAAMDPVVAAGARLQAGESLLVLGAGGGVGLAAVEIGALLGARVIAAAGSADKLAAAREHGAAETIDYRAESLRDRLKELTAGQGVDVTYDPVGGEMTELAVRATAWGGRVLVVGFAAGDIPKIPMNLLLLKGCALVGVFWGSFRTREPEVEAENFRRLFAWHAEGKLRPHVSRVLPLEAASEALRALADRKVIGKIVLTTGAGV